MHGQLWITNQQLNPSKIEQNRCKTGITRLTSRKTHFFAQKNPAKMSSSQLESTKSRHQPTPKMNKIASLTRKTLIRNHAHNYQSTSNTTNTRSDNQEKEKKKLKIPIRLSINIRYKKYNMAWRTEREADATKTRSELHRITPRQQRTPRARRAHARKEEKKGKQTSCTRRPKKIQNGRECVCISEKRGGVTYVGRKNRERRGEECGQEYWRYVAGGRGV